MKQKNLRRFLILLALLLLSGAFMAACRFLPSLAENFSNHFIQPFSLALAGLTAKLPFPLFEVLLIGLALGACLLLARTLLKHSLAALAELGLALLSLLTAIFALYALLWYPAYWVPVSSQAEAAQSVLVLCESLIDQLNEAELSFSNASITLKKAAAVASDFLDADIPQNAVKAARYPEWMEALRIAGLYSPWTGEALVNAENARPALPFTAVHELMHLGGIADEGSANIAAWEAATAYGGEFADSARLWALHYGMSALTSSERSQLAGRMNGRLKYVFEDMNGFSPFCERSEGFFTRMIAFAGLRSGTSNYSDLINHLLFDSASAS